MLMSNSSFFVSFDTLVCFLSSVFTPSSLRSKNKLISSSEYRPQFFSRVPNKGRYLHTGEDFWKLSDSAEHLPDQTICTAKGGVDFGTDANQSTWDGKLEMIALGM